MSDSFDANGLLAALTAAMAGGEDGIGFTTRELCEKLGRGDFAVRNALRKIAESGKLGVSKKRATAINGRPQWVDSYYVK